MNKFLSAICAFAILTVVGTGVVSAPPDYATINMTIETKHSDIQTAQDESARIIDDLAKSLAEYGIGESDIKTTWFNIYPDYGYCGRNSTCYRVSNHLTITVRNIDNISKVISTAAELGANNINGVQFGITDNSTTYNEVLTKAVENAKQKAAHLSTLTGLGELQIVSIKENHDPYSIINYHRNSSVMPSNIEVSATVKITFKTKPCHSEHSEESQTDPNNNKSQIHFANPDLNEPSYLNESNYLESTTSPCHLNDMTSPSNATSILPNCDTNSDTSLCSVL